MAAVPAPTTVTSVVARAPAWLAPTVVGAAATAGAAVVAVVDPNAPGHYPTCPFLALTGQWCPGCGTLRAVHALVHGDLLGAIDLNVLTVALLPMLLVGWVVWLRRGLAGRRDPVPVPTWLGMAVAVAVPAFWLVRNLPVGAALAP